MKRLEHRAPNNIKKQKTKRRKTKTSHVAYLWEFENFIKERLKALGIIQ